MGRRPATGSAFVPALLAALLVALAAPAHATVEAGKALFAARGCGGCHTVDGVGGAVGPDLSAAGTVPGHDHAWHVRHLMDPAAVVPGSIMPKMARNELEAAELADYLVSLGTGQAAPAAPVTAAPQAPAPPAAAKPAPAPAVLSAPAPAPAAAAPEAVARGEALYAAKGCAGCHTIRGMGGTLGPDLTFEGEVAGHDADWHRRHLADPRSVSPGSGMPPFKLSPEEADDLIAFLTHQKRRAEDRALSPELARRFAALGTTLEALRGRVERAHVRGRNVDDLKVELSQAGTHVGTVEEMARRENVVGAEAEIAGAEATAAQLADALDEFDRQLRERLYLAAGTVAMLLFGCWVILRKVRLLSLEWDAAESEREGRRKQGRRGPAPAPPEGEA